MKKSEYPTSIWVALGAGEYTEWGQKNFLQPGDESLVIIYDEKKYPKGPSELEVAALMDEYPAPDGIIAVRQTFV